MPTKQQEISDIARNVNITKLTVDGIILNVSKNFKENILDTCHIFLFLFVRCVFKFVFAAARSEADVSHFHTSQVHISSRR